MFWLVGFVFHKMDKAGKRKEVKWVAGREKGRERREKKRGRKGRTEKIRSLGPVAGLQLQLWSVFIQMVFNLFFHTVFRS